MSPYEILIRIPQRVRQNSLTNPDKIIHTLKVNPLPEKATLGHIIRLSNALYKGMPDHLTSDPQFCLALMETATPHNLKKWVYKVGKRYIDNVDESFETRAQDILFEAQLGGITHGMQSLHTTARNRTVRFNI